MLSRGCYSPLNVALSRRVDFHHESSIYEQETKQRDRRWTIWSLALREVSVIDFGKRSFCIERTPVTLFGLSNKKCQKRERRSRVTVFVYELLGVKKGKER